MLQCSKHGGLWAVQKGAAAVNVTLQPCVRRAVRSHISNHCVTTCTPAAASHANLSTSSEEECSSPPHVPVLFRQVLMLFLKILIHDPGLRGCPLEGLL